MSERERIEELAALFTFLAEHDFHDYSPLYERIARMMASRPDLLAFVDASAAANTRRGRVPVLFHAALHDVALRFPDDALGRAFAGDASIDLTDAVDDAIERRGTVLVDTMRTRSVQTNEVGRSAAIAAGLAAIDPDGRELALVELGPSAGLNLFVDRWRIDYRRDDGHAISIGPEESPVRLSCELRGPHTPSTLEVPSIAVRTGVDPAPIDASDPEQARWLRACVWPDVPDRPQRLAAALALVALQPPQLVRGDATTDLAPMVASLDADLFPVVVSTWAMAYVSADGRAEISRSLDEIGATRDMALLTLEEPRFTPGLVDPDVAVDTYYAAGDGTPTMLALRTWRDGVASSSALAMCHPHVRWMWWLDGGNDG